MIEDDIRALTQEIRLLRKAIESQCSLPALNVSQPPEPLHRSPEVRPSPPLSDSLNEHEAAKMTGLSVATLRNWRLFRQGPPYRKLGAAVRYSRIQIQRWMDSQPGLRLEESGPSQAHRAKQPCRG